MEDDPRLLPVILSGGIGARLWPASRRDRPKQLLPLVGDDSMIAETLQRASALDGSATPMIVTNAGQAAAIRSELGPTDVAFVLEPVGRNTAPAIAAAAAVASVQGQDPLLLVLPSDHAITDPGAFAAAVERGRAAAMEGMLVTFGIEPRSPETGYGYIKRGKAINDGVFEAEAFKEKPDEGTAVAYLESGEYLWNSGMFLFRSSALLDELRMHDEAMLTLVEKAVADAADLPEGLVLDAEPFGAIAGTSIDYAVMEHTDRKAVVPCDPGWSDVGSWASLWEIAEKDADGNTVRGDVITVDTHGSVVHGGERLVAVVGLGDVVVVDTDDALLVASRDQAQRVKEVVDRLEEERRAEVDAPEDRTT